MRLIKVLAVLLVAGAAGVAVYAYLGDMAPAQREITIQLSPGGG